MSSEIDNVCKWLITVDEEDVWNTGCGKMFCTIEGNLRDNEFKYCPYCGKKIEEVMANETGK